MTAGPSKCVLVVEDDPDLQELLVAWFENDPRCLRAAGVGSAGEGLQAAIRLHPDIVLLDYNLRAETCTTILRALRAALPLSRIVVHSASHHAALAADVLGLGADAVIEKGRLPIASLVDSILD